VPTIAEAVGLHKRFGEGEVAVDALTDVSVAFPAGDFAAIMGPSGSGKSTLMHVLAGLDSPTSGSVRIAGIEITALNDRELTHLRRERIGFIFQTFNLLPVLNASPTASGSIVSWTRSASATASPTARRRCPAASSSA